MNILKTILGTYTLKDVQKKQYKCPACGKVMNVCEYDSKIYQTKTFVIECPDREKCRYLAQLDSRLKILCEGNIGIKF